MTDERFDDLQDALDNIADSLHEISVSLGRLIKLYEDSLYKPPGRTMEGYYGRVDPPR